MIQRIGVCGLPPQKLISFDPFVNCIIVILVNFRDCAIFSYFFSVLSDCFLGWRCCDRNNAHAPVCHTIELEASSLQNITQLFCFKKMIDESINREIPLYFSASMTSYVLSTQLCHNSCSNSVDVENTKFAGGTCPGNMIVWCSQIHSSRHKLV